MTRWLCSIVFATVGLWSTAAVAEDSAPTQAALAPLGLDDVLESVARTHPDLEVASVSASAASERRQAARGGWDPVLAVRSKWSPVGYYRNADVDTQVRQATPFWGIGLQAGYRVGWGDFPVYQGGRRTLSAGEVRVGVEVPLWKDGPIDERRAKIRRAKADAKAARCAESTAALELARDASVAYWRWVATGQEIQIQRDLLAVAELRDEGLRVQADLGSLAPIVIVDNERLLLDREAKLVSARREFQAASLGLSLYLRDARQRPVRASERAVPSAIPAVVVDLPEEADDIDAALARRPEVCELQQARAKAEVDVDLARNRRAPAIDLTAFVARDFGFGAPDLAPTELVVGLGFEMPLALREARGNLRAARSDARRVDAQLRGQQDRIAAQVRQARVDLRAARAQVELARRQVAAARALAEAERDKLREGASDLVIVNLRELAAADAARLEVEALAAHQQAYADYLFATGRLPEPEAFRLSSRRTP